MAQPRGRRIPIDCTDGFQEAFYARPEAFLVPAVRQSQSAWGFLDPNTEAQCVDRLERDLKNGFHRTLSEFDLESR